MFFPHIWLINKFIYKASVLALSLTLSLSSPLSLPCVTLYSALPTRFWRHFCCLLRRRGSACFHFSCALAIVIFCFQSCFYFFLLLSAFLYANCCYEIVCRFDLCFDFCKSKTRWTFREDWIIILICFIYSKIKHNAMQAENARVSINAKHARVLLLTLRFRSFIGLFMKRVSNNI